MTEPRKKPPPQGHHPATATATTTELINIRFYENQKRQALTTTEEPLPPGDDVDVDDNISSGGAVAVAVVGVTPSNLLQSPQPQPPPTMSMSMSGPGSLSVPDTGGHHQHHHEEIVESAPSSSSSGLALELAVSEPPPSDKSRKGSVDQRIWNLVNLINGLKHSFFTTSSCSGRIILYTWDTKTEDSSVVPEASSKLKKGCKWLLVSHDEIQAEELVNAVDSYASSRGTENCMKSGDDDVYFKMEPCILHVQCRTLTNARKLIHLATESGFRNSGMVIGKENRMTVAIRSAMGMEVPLPCTSTSETGKIVSDEYLTYLAGIANSKMRENWTRCEKLTSLFSSTTWKE